MRRVKRAQGIAQDACLNIAGPLVKLLVQQCVSLVLHEHLVGGVQCHIGSGDQPKFVRGKNGRGNDPLIAVVVGDGQNVCVLGDEPYVSLDLQPGQVGVHVAGEEDANGRRER